MSFNFIDHFILICEHHFENVAVADAQNSQNTYLVQASNSYEPPSGVCVGNKK